MSALDEQVFSAVITKGEIAFVSYFPELGVTSQGQSEEEAIDNLREAVELYLEDEDVQKTFLIIQRKLSGQFSLSNSAAF